MASLRHFRRRSCENKIGYPSKEAAAMARKALDKKRFTGAIAIYGPCRFCGKFHIGHKSRKKH